MGGSFESSRAQERNQGRYGGKNQDEQGVLPSKVGSPLHYAAKADENRHKSEGQQRWSPARNTGFPSKLLRTPSFSTLCRAVLRHIVIPNPLPSRGEGLRCLVKVAEKRVMQACDTLFGRG